MQEGNLCSAAVLSGAAFTFDQENIYSAPLHVDDDNKKNVLAAAGVFPHLQSSSSQGRAARSLSISLYLSLSLFNKLFISCDELAKKTNHFKGSIS